MTQKADKKVAILQSNYIPWKGYFDLIASVDEFILYDDAQFTKNDWRNRNQIKTPQGLHWLSIPTGKNISRRIRDVELPDSKWQIKHWKSLVSNYRKATYFEEVATWLEPLYLAEKYTSLSAVNRRFIEAICNYLGIFTKISNSWEYDKVEGKTERLVSFCEQSNASSYVSGPSAKNYIEEELFINKGIKLEWTEYSNYQEYPQLWGTYVHQVSIVDLLFNCGSHSNNYLNSGK